MRAGSKFVLLPIALKVAVIFFSAVPFLSFFIGPRPWDFMPHPATALLVAVTYWGLPTLLALSILFRHGWFFPLCLLQSLSLAMHCYSFESGASSGRPLHLALIVLMALLSPFFADQDFIYPFLTSRSRFWRRARRKLVRYPLQVLVSQERRFPAEMADCSLTGMGIVVASPELMAYLVTRREGDEVDLEVSLASGRYLIPTKLVWFDAKGLEGRLGVEFTDPKLMGPIVSSVTGKGNTTTVPLVEQFVYLWVSNKIRYVALGLWLLAISGAYFGG